MKNILKFTIIFILFFTMSSVFAATFTTSFTDESNYTKDAEIEVSGGLGRIELSPLNSNILTKTASNGWGNSGARSQSVFSGDGEITTEAEEINSYRMIGLSTSNMDNNYSTIEFAAYLSVGGSFNVYENGSSKGAHGTYVNGDIIKVSREGTQIKYYVNGSLRYTSLITAPAGDLLADSSFYQNGSTLKDSKMNGDIIHWIDTVGASLVETTASGATYPIGTFSLTKTIGDTSPSVASFTGFTVTEGVVTGSLNYQLSVDGIAWQYWNGTAWVSAIISQYNTEADINANISNFSGSANAIYVKMFMISDGTQEVEIDEIQINYIANNTPTDIQLNGSNTGSVNENLSLGTTISTITTSDIDAADTHTYILVNGIGDSDNAKFQIGTGVDDDKIKLNFVPDFETPIDLGDTAGNNTYTIRLEANDGNGGTYQESFVINVNDLNTAPTNITLSSLNFNEGLAANTTIANLSSIDDGEDGVLVYSLPSFGDNVNFTISGSNLGINSIPDFETKQNYSVKISINDGVHNYEQIFIINVIDLDENIPVISIVGSSAINVILNNIYIDPGATANDDVDGDITLNVITVNPLDTTTLGTYTITYNVNDSNGNSAVQVTRTVNVVEKKKKKSSKKIPKKKLKEIFVKKEEKKIKSLCEDSKILTQNLKAGDRNGKYSLWEKETITEVKILQGHMNQLGFNAGDIDGVLGPLTDAAIKRMQVSLGFSGNLVDGLVGVYTRSRINNSCKNGLDTQVVKPLNNSGDLKKILLEKVTNLQSQIDEFYKLINSL